MNPCRELDALVAEKVMGWQVCRCTPLDIDEWTATSPHRYTLWQEFRRGDGKRCPRCEAPTLRPYSTDIAAAWEVVEKLRAPSTTIDIRAGFLETKVWVIQHHGRQPGVHSYEAQEKTAPHAICLAALKAIGHGVGT
jgi:hypothetical protein